MKTQRHTTALLCAITVTTCVGAQLFAGSLTPPTGAPAPTMKTLSQVEPRTIIDTVPYTIASPGSYYLTGNLVGAPGSDGIIIDSSDVTLDLNGFTLAGVPGSLDGVTVISSTPSYANIAIKNGVVRGWADNGIDTTFAENSRIDGVFAMQNGAEGIVTGIAAIITDSLARQNGATGIRILGNGGRISNCQSSGNGGMGILGSDVVIAHCITTTNTGTAGIYCSDGVVRECTSNSNPNGSGFVVFRSVISNCTAESNGANGILAYDENLILNNNCARHSSGAGILIEPFREGNTVSGNHCVYNNLGIDVQGLSNVVTKNVSGGSLGSGTPSANYNVVAGNDLGVLGAAASVQDPWANIEY